MVKANAHTDYRLYDVRVRRRLLDAGIIKQKDVDKFLAGLPDMADEAEPSEVQLHEKKSESGE